MFEYLSCNQGSNREKAQNVGQDGHRVGTSAFEPDDEREVRQVVAQALDVRIV